MAATSRMRTRAASPSSHQWRANASRAATHVLIPGTESVADCLRYKQVFISCSVAERRAQPGQQMRHETLTVTLERLGSVRRQPDPDDRRAKRIVLTERGLASVRAALETIAALEAKLEASLGRERYRQLHETLTRIVELGPSLLARSEPRRRSRLIPADDRRRASDSPEGRGHLILRRPGVGTRLLREASIILTRISAQTGPVGRFG